MAELAERARSITRSQIRVLFDLAERTDGDLVRLEVGEPDFDTPAHVVDAARDGALAGHTHYTASAGIRPLREAIADYAADNHGVDYGPEGVVVTNGGNEAMLLTALATLDPGDELLIPTPGWPNYWAHAEFADAVPVEVPMPEPYDLDADRVVEAMGPATGAVVLNTPNNPTGRVYDDDEIRAVVEAAADHDAYVVADEVYGDLVYDEEFTGTAALTGHPDHVVTVNSCSKTFAMTGWRVGWLAADPDVADAAATMHEPTSSCASSVSQQAALAALTGDQTPFEEMFEAFRERRDYVVDRVDAMEGASTPRPEGAFYAFLDVDLPGSSLDVAKRLCTDHGVVLAPGGGFGEVGEGSLRLSFANSMDRIEAGLDRIEAALD
jgi:aspartate aminotransferase